LFKLNADGSSTGLTTAISVDLLSSSYVTDVEGIVLTGASPDFTREQFLAHAQAKINASLNDYAVDATTDVVDGTSALGVADQLFARSVGQSMDAILTETQIVNIKHMTSSVASGTAPTTGDVTANDKYLVYSYQGKRPNLSVYDNKTAVASGGVNTVVFDATQNTMTINFGSAPSNISINEKIRIAGEFTNADATSAAYINGREFTVSNVSGNAITINTTGLSFPDDGFTLTEEDIFVLSDQSEDVEAFFEGSQNVYEGAQVNFSSEKIVIREAGTDALHHYTNKQVSDLNILDGALPFTASAVGGATLTAGSYTVTDTGSNGTTKATFSVTNNADGTRFVRLLTAGAGYAVGDSLTLAAASVGSTADITLTVTGSHGIFEVVNAEFDITQTVAGTVKDSLDVLGLASADGVASISTSTDWVDEKAPAIKVNYDEVTQRLQFTVDRTVLGTGTNSNFNSFSIFGASTAEESNNLGIPTQDDAEEVLIRGGEV